MDYKAGDEIKVKTKDKVYNGIFIPQKGNSIVLKLKSGYNVGIDKKKIEKISLVKKHKQEKIKEKKIKQNKKLPTISILHTGGTIASRVDYTTGAVVAKFKPEELVEMLPELKGIAVIKSKLVSNLQSESMRFGHYNLMAKEIIKELKSKPDGIIITHGTDTLHFTSAALAFMLQGIDIPVILVGAQRSSDRGSSDSSLNLISAAKFIAKTDFKGVAICMHASTEDNKAVILPATKTRKMHTSRRDAFKAINDEPIAFVDPYKDIVGYKSKTKNKEGKLEVKYFKEDIKVGILKSHTNLYPKDFEHFKDYKGLVLEGTGLGHMQTKGFDKISQINEDNKKALSKIAKTAVVILTSQCIFGRVNLNVYTPQRELLDIGVISGEDMTTETAFIKLAFLLSNYPKEKVKELMLKNIAGEISERTQANEYL